MLFDFLPAGEMLNAAEAIVRVFHRLGDYQHKHKNRMKFLIKQLGWERFKAEVLQEYEAVRRQRRPAPALRARRASGRGSAGVAASG